MNTIKEQWDFFEKMCLTGVSTQQHEEAYTAFHAGIMALMQMQMKLAEKKISPEMATAIFQEWIDEMDSIAQERIARAGGIDAISKTH